MQRNISIVIRTCIASLLLLAGAGCGALPPAHPADQATLERTRQALGAKDSAVRVGVVTALEPRGNPYAAVSNAPTADFHVGDTVSFIDSNRQTLTSGFVRRVTDDSVHVEWVKPGAKGRVPMVGDMVVHYPQSDTTMSAPAPTTAPASNPAS